MYRNLKGELQDVIRDAGPTIRSRRMCQAALCAIKYAPGKSVHKYNVISVT